jgi:hypothetical protein
MYKSLKVSLKLHIYIGYEFMAILFLYTDYPMYVEGTLYYVAARPVL